MRKGVPVSPGVAVAPALCLDDVLNRPEPRRLEPADVPAELTRLDSACAATVRELDALIVRLSSQLSEDEVSIFRSHRALVRDPGLIGKVKAAIRDRRVDARTALLDTLAEYAELFAKIPDDYLKERAADLRDVVGRILTHLEGPGAVPLPPGESFILVARELFPSHAGLLEKLPLAGIVTEVGGSVGHGAILARALGIPAVSGLAGIGDEVHAGDLIALDGREGYVYVNPDGEVQAVYRQMQREYGNLRDRLVENRDQEPRTADGVELTLLANVNGAADAALAGRVGADGVGLYRTEYLFLTHAGVPDEEEQLAVYRAVIEAAPHRRVTLRGLDLGGGDKNVPYLGSRAEANPALGWRSIRLIPAHPEFFRVQVQAVLRAALHGEVRLLFPMVSRLEEVRQLRQLVAEAAEVLRRRQVPFAANLPLGIMVEIPAAAVCMDALAPEVDFVSIGSNDLAQYLMAADRGNPQVSHLCEPFTPALYRLIHHILETCGRSRTPVTLCGEMAGRPRCLLPLLGMGLRRLSMSPALLPSVKEFIRRTPLAAAEEAAREVLRLKTEKEIVDFLTAQARRIWAEAALLDTGE